MSMEQLTNLDIALKIIALDQRPVLERMFQYYLHDMSEYAGWPISDDGSFTVPHDLLSPYWVNPDHYPYFIRTRDQIAGFCLVRQAPDDHQLWDMGQFFVLRAFRCNDVGRQAFQKALTMHTGQWQVRVLVENTPAYQFWKSSITGVTNGHFSEASQPYKNQQMTFLTFKTNLKA